jgi:hypothetical protein
MFCNSSIAFVAHRLGYAFRRSRGEENWGELSDLRSVDVPWTLDGHGAAALP